MQQTTPDILTQGKTPLAGRIRCQAPASRRPNWILGAGLAGLLLAGTLSAARCAEGGGQAQTAPVPAATQAAVPPPPVPLEVGAGPVVGVPMPPTPGRPRIEGNVSLDDAVRIALANHPSIGTARADVATAEARAVGARAMARPSLSANTYATMGSMGSILQSPVVVGGPQATLAVPSGRFLDQNFMLMVPLYTGGRLGAEVRAAGARQSAAAHGLQATTRDVVLSTQEDYWGAVFAFANVAVFNENLALNAESLRIAEERLAVGKTPRLDVLRRRTEVASARQLLANAMRDAEQGMVALKTTLGVSLDSPITVTDRLSFTPVGGTLQEYATAARQNRSEIAVAAEQVRAVAAMVASARGNYRPQVYAAGMVDLNTGSRVGSMSGYTAGVVASIPLVDAGARRAQVTQAEADLARMRQEAANVDLTVARDVSDAWLMLRTADQNIATTRTALAEADEGYRVMVQRYEAGRATTVEVLDALAALTRARVNEQQALYEHNIARDRLERATASGALPVTAPPAVPAAPPAGPAAAPASPAPAGVMPGK